MAKWDDRKQQLENRLASLDVKMHDIEHTLEKPKSRDFEEFATEEEGTEVLERMGTKAQREVHMIQAALTRITKGDYGTCQSCGLEISEPRLDILPFTPICRICANSDYN